MAKKPSATRSSKSSPRKHPFTIEAFVLLPDHFHCIWSLPTGDANYSTRWRLIKEKFTRTYLDNGGTEAELSQSRSKKSERGVWHAGLGALVSDKDDVNRCFDYIHWNPVKHGLVKRVRDYPQSSFHRFVKMGVYPVNWGAVDPCPGYDVPEWE